MRLTEFSGRKVVVAGYGREGQAACRALLKHHPDQPLTVVATERVAIAHEKLNVIQERPDQSRALLEADVIVSSPGISPYRGALAKALNRGIKVTSGTEVFFAERGGANAVCITGTQGKSTTVALTAHGPAPKAPEPPSRKIGGHPKPQNTPPSIRDWGN